MKEYLNIIFFYTHLYISSWTGSHACMASFLVCMKAGYGVGVARTSTLTGLTSCQSRFRLYESLEPQFLKHKCGHFHSIFFFFWNLSNHILFQDIISLLWWYLINLRFYFIVILRYLLRISYYFYKLQHIWNKIVYELWNLKWSDIKSKQWYIELRPIWL